MPITWSTWLGNGVNRYGVTALPLHSAARIYFVNSGHINKDDGNGFGDPDQPLATLAAAVTALRGGFGDKILLAETTSYDDVFGTTLNASKGGLSALFPTEIGTYDPAAPLDVSRYGRAQGANRPRLMMDGEKSMLSIEGGDAGAAFFAFRGFKLDAMGTGDRSIGTSVSGTNHVLYENLDLYQAGLVLQGASKEYFIVRRCLIRDQFPAVERASGMYTSDLTYLRIEGGLCDHAGWARELTRDDEEIAPNVFNHALYLDNNNSANHELIGMFIADPSSHGVQLRAGGLVSSNFFLDCPNPILAGGGEDYDVQEPDGIEALVEHNTIWGGAHIQNGDSGMHRASGISPQNTTAPSRFRHNLLARNPHRGTVNNCAFGPAAFFEQPTLGTFENNIVYDFADPVVSENLGAEPDQVDVSYSGNVTDQDTLGGTNKTVAQALLDASLVTPNAYTYGGLFTAAGFADRDAAIAAQIANTERLVADELNIIAKAGFGQSYTSLARGPETSFTVTVNCT